MGALVFPVKLGGSACAPKYFAKSGFNADQDCKDVTAAEGHIKPPNQHHISENGQHRIICTTPA